MLGGSSALNGMAYVRGHKADFDSWERLGCHGWGWKNVLSYFLKLENDLRYEGSSNIVACVLVTWKNGENIGLT